MADERDDNSPGYKPPDRRDRGTEAALPQPSPGDVAQEVARVVNLLQRLEQLHAKPVAASPLAPAHPGRTGGLSALRPPDQRAEAPQSRARFALPQAPPPLPSSDSATPPPLATLTSATPSPLAELWRDPAVPMHDDDAEPGFAELVANPAAASQARLPSEPTSRVPLAALGLLAMVSAVVAALGLWRLQTAGAPHAAAALVATPPSKDEAVVRPGSDPRAPGPMAVTDSDPSAAPASEQAATRSDTPSGCSAAITGTLDGAMTFDLNDPARADQPITIKVDDLSYPTSFDARGWLHFEAPLLSSRALVSWELANGASCQKGAQGSLATPLLRLALVWTGADTLDFHVIEPNAWFGSPTGHVSIANPNRDLSHGAGHVQTYGQGRDGPKIAVYAVDPGRIPAGAVLNAFVKPAPIERSPSGATANANLVRQATASDAGQVAPTCGDQTRPMHASQIPYQLLILRSGPQAGEFSRETRSFSMAIPPCGATALARERAERIIVKN